MDNDTISRQAIKEKLQEHYDFFVNTYDGFENMPSNIKLRVDEITNCIAEVVNIPAVQPEQKTGRWINDKHNIPRCSCCSYIPEYSVHINDYYYSDYCPNYGAKMKSEVTE